MDLPVWLVRVCKRCSKVERWLKKFKTVDFEFHFLITCGLQALDISVDFLLWLSVRVLGLAAAEFNSETCCCVLFSLLSKIVNELLVGQELEENNSSGSSLFGKLVLFFGFKWAAATLLNLEMVLSFRTVTQVPEIIVKSLTSLTFSVIFFAAQDEIEVHLKFWKRSDEYFDFLKSFGKQDTPYIFPNHFFLVHASSSGVALMLRDEVIFFRV